MPLFDRSTPKNHRSPHLAGQPPRLPSNYTRSKTYGPYPVQWYGGFKARGRFVDSRRCTHIVRINGRTGRIEVVGSRSHTSFRKLGRVGVYAESSRHAGSEIS